MRKNRQLGAKAALAILGTLLAVLIAEASLRLAGVAYPRFYTRDPYCGSALRPGASGWWAREGHSFVKINSDGLRDREHRVVKPAHTLRIAILGDSYAEAMQVAVRDTFWAVTERRLKDCPALHERDVEAINFGVAGYGTAQELMTLRHRVWKYSPDVVVLAITTGNDIRNNSKLLEPDRGRPFFVLNRAGRLVLDDSFRKAWRHGARYSLPHRIMLEMRDHCRVLEAVHHVVNTVREWRAERAAGPGSEAGLDDAVYLNPPPSPVWRQAWEVTECLIEAIDKEVRAHHAMFLAVTLSNGIQVNPHSSVRKAFMRRLGVKDLFYPDERIKALRQCDGFEVLNLARPLLAYAEKNHVYLHGFPNAVIGGGHWNEVGHRLAGVMIAEKLCEMLESDRGEDGKFGSRR